MSFMEFVDMRGYGSFIWSSFLLTAVLLAAEIFLIKRQKQDVLRRLRRLIRMNRNNDETKT